MNKNKNEIIRVFDELSDVGNGVLAVPPQNEKEQEERDRLMQEYLTKKRINLSLKTGTLK
ncbi:hypothetical protein [Paenibacillus polymyxa]|uniref:hypothetical protein n=1 Tax=Paenibacillus polymyxa TaxID=1406 RepID=UPI0002E2598F|nr:hypothetical protein [Paenibacillus polymyxa]